MESNSNDIKKAAQMSSSVSGNQFPLCHIPPLALSVVIAPPLEKQLYSVQEIPPYHGTKHSHQEPSLSAQAGQKKHKNGIFRYAKGKITNIISKNKKKSNEMMINKSSNSLNMSHQQKHSRHNLNADNADRMSYYESSGAPREHHSTSYKPSESQKHSHPALISQNSVNVESPPNTSLTPAYSSQIIKMLEEYSSKQDSIIQELLEKKKQIEVEMEKQVANYESEVELLKKSNKQYVEKISAQVEKQVKQLDTFKDELIMKNNNDIEAFASKELAEINKKTRKVDDALENIKVRSVSVVERTIDQLFTYFISGLALIGTVFLYIYYYILSVFVPSQDRKEKSSPDPVRKRTKTKQVKRPTKIN